MPWTLLVRGATRYEGPFHTRPHYLYLIHTLKDLQGKIPNDLAKILSRPKPKY